MAEKDSDEARFRMMCGHVRTVAETLLTEFFGERCPEFEGTCEVCLRWASLDRLLADPWEDGPREGLPEETRLIHALCGLSDGKATFDSVAEMMAAQLHREKEALQKLLFEWVLAADRGEFDGVDLDLMVRSEEATASLIAEEDLKDSRS